MSQRTASKCRNARLVDRCASGCERHGALEDRDGLDAERVRALGIVLAGASAEVVVVREVLPPVDRVAEEDRVAVRCREEGGRQGG